MKFKCSLLILSNVIFLILLLFVWVDGLEKLVSEALLLEQFVKVNLALLCSVIGIWLLNMVSNRLALSKSMKMKLAFTMVIACFSFLYFDYGTKIINNRFVNASMRNEIILKVKHDCSLAYGYRILNLDVDEYNEIQKSTWFPEIPSSARRIELAYCYDGFLPDYSFSLSYFVPIVEEISVYEYNKNGFTESQRVEVVGHEKLVEYLKIER